MKKIIGAIVIGFAILSAVPAFAEIPDNASPRAVQAQIVNLCRDIMKESVKIGDMSQDQLKACIEMMKSSQCMENL